MMKIELHTHYTETLLKRAGFEELKGSINDLLSLAETCLHDEIKSTLENDVPTLSLGKLSMFIEMLRFNGWGELSLDEDTLAFITEFNELPLLSPLEYNQIFNTVAPTINGYLGIKQENQ